ncbi:MAG: cation-transporting P-type ATPase, partial [Patescibacteria group bacterium]
MEPYLASVEEVLRELRVRPDRGLSGTEVNRRQAHWGKNVIPRDDPWRLLKIFFERFRDPLVVILLAAGVISVATGEIGDAIIIVIALLLDIALSFAQVLRTERTLQRLRAEVPDLVSVIRHGKSQPVPVESLVVGDVMEVRSGERVPADARVIRSQG